MRGHNPDAAHAERLRHMLLVRKQEFGYLRTVLREQGHSADHVMGGFPGRSAKGARARDETLKKIDAVEAQLESLWVASRAKIPVDGLPLADAPSPSPDAGKAKAGLSRTQEAPRPVVTPPALLMDGGVQWDLNEGRTTHTGVRWTAILDTAASDETIVSAAVLFAHGNPQQAAEHLLTALKAKQAREEHTFTLVLCLLEALRAMGDQNRFDWAVLEYVEYWNGVTPQWRTDAAPDQPGTKRNNKSSASGQDDGADEPLEAFWRCPPTWDAEASAVLCQDLENKRSYAIDWAELQHITPQAAAVASSSIEKLCQRPVHLVFFSTANLLAVLRNSTPQGKSLSDRSAWTLRFGLLQLAREHEEFERAALDYCMTYLETAPNWKPALGSFVSDGVAPARAAMGRKGEAGPIWHLQGEILGSYALGLPDPQQHPGPTPIRVACHDLVRMDGSSTSALLEWISTAQSHACEIHFDGVSLLVAAFWSALGIDSQVHIHLRGLR